MIPTMIDLEPAEVAAKEVSVSDQMECNTMCYYDVMCLAFVFSKNDRMCSTYHRSFNAMAYATKMGTTSYELFVDVHDCDDVMQRGHLSSGVYTILLRDKVTVLNVYCEISTDENWLILQRRTDGSEDFNRTWNEYKDGFGDLNNEFWLGNTNIHRITSHGRYEMKINVQHDDGYTYYALYKDFYVASEQDYFRLTFGEYSGNYVKTLSYHYGMKFSARDRDLDSCSKKCALSLSSGWWFKCCYDINLNGIYRNRYGIYWNPPTEASVKTIFMKIRPME